MATQTVAYTTVGTKASISLDPNLDPFSVNIACALAVGTTADYSLQYSLDPLTTSDASAIWYTSNDIPLGTTTSAVSLFTSPVSRIRLVIVALAGTLTIQSLQAGGGAGTTTRLSTNMLQLPPVSGLDGSEWVWTVQGGTDKRATTGDLVDAAAGIPQSQYVLLSPNGFLTESRTLTGTSGTVVLTDNGAQSTVVISLNAAGVFQLITAPRTITAAGAVTVADDDVAIYMRQTVAQAVAINLPAATDKIGPVFISDANGVASGFNFTLTPNGAETIVGLSTYALTNDYQSVLLRPIAGVGWIL